MSATAVKEVFIIVSQCLITVTVGAVLVIEILDKAIAAVAVTLLV
jgi:hypothetical protein